jgi:hypothetical protein
MATPKFLPNITLQYNTAFPTLISKLFSIMRSKAPSQILSSAHNEFHILKLVLSFPKASSFLKGTSMRRTSGHCLGAFKAGEKNICTSP